MCNGILTFTNMEFGNIRIVEKDGELWFAASDICKCFGETNRNRAMQELDDDEKGIRKSRQQAVSSAFPS